MSEQDSKPDAGAPQAPKPEHKNEPHKRSDAGKGQKKNPPPAKAKSGPSASSSEKATPPSPPSAAGAPARTGNGGQPRRRGALWLALLALLIALLAVLGAAYLWQQQQQLRAALQAQGNELQGTADALRGDWRSRSDELQRRTEALGQEQQQLRESVDSVRELAGRSRRDWVLAEVEYLLRIANQRLQLQHDVATAIAALDGADARLRELADPGLTTIRQRVARELSALRATPRPDLAGMALQLSSLSEEVARLPVKAARAPARTAPERVQLPLQAEDWRQGLARAWDALKGLVVIRRRDEPIAPLLGPEQEFAVREGLRLQLNGARLALLRQEPELYGTSIQGARDWLERYFVADDPAVIAMADRLQQLSERRVMVELPDISDSLRALRDLMRQRGLDTDPVPQDSAPAPAESAPEPGAASDAAAPSNPPPEPSTADDAPAAASPTDVSAPAQGSVAAEPANRAAPAGADGAGR